jgi:prepilin peptidase CpaA
MRGRFQKKRPRSLHAHGYRMQAEILILGVLPLLLALAAGWDLASYTIPNRLQVALLASFAIFIFVGHLTLAQLGVHVLAGLIGLVAGFALFSLGYIGGGDAKFFACTALWFGLGDLLEYALIASVIGGALTLALLSFRGVAVPPFLVRQGWIARLHDAKQGIPYGIALAAAGLVILPHAEIFRHAVAA